MSRKPSKPASHSNFCEPAISDTQKKRIVSDEDEDSNIIKKAAAILRRRKNNCKIDNLKKNEKEEDGDDDDSKCISGSKRNGEDAFDDLLNDEPVQKRRRITIHLD